MRRSGGGATLLDTAAAALGPSVSEVVWDSYRREDGRWIVTATGPDGAAAAWTYDHQGRNLHALDERARALMGVAPAPADDNEIDLAAALDLAREVPVVREDVRPHLVAVPAAADEEDGSEAPAPDAVDIAEEVGHPVTREYEQETITLPREPAPSEAPAAEQPEARKPARKARGRKGRASVPSWDEILFGAGRSDD